jgi:hypothetical protein
MTSATALRRTLLVTLACVTLVAPAALARPAAQPSESPTSSLSGTKGTVFEHVFDPYPEPASRRDAALAEERSYSNAIKPTRLVETAPAVVADDDGISSLSFALAVFGALAVGLGAGSGLHRVHTRRHGARLAT